MLVRHVLQAKGHGTIHIHPEATVAEALNLFVPNNIGSLPVVDSWGRLVGIFTERDVLRGAHHDGASFGHRRIREVMTSNPVTCTPSDPVHEVMGLLSRHRIGQLPVLLGDELVGLVTVGDLVRALYEQAEAENRNLFAYVQGRA